MFRANVSTDGFITFSGKYRIRYTNVFAEQKLLIIFQKKNVIVSAVMTLTNNLSTFELLNPVSSVCMKQRSCQDILSQILRKPVSGQTQYAQTTLCICSAWLGCAQFVH